LIQKLNTFSEESFLPSEGSNVTISFKTDLEIVVTDLSSTKKTFEKGAEYYEKS
jgi:hypothetical protein